MAPRIMPCLADCKTLCPTPFSVFTNFKSWPRVNLPCGRITGLFGGEQLGRGGGADHACFIHHRDRARIDPQRVVAQLRQCEVDGVPGVAAFRPGRRRRLPARSGSAPGRLPTRFAPVRDTFREWVFPVPAGACSRWISYGDIAIAPI
jgi:hypothetical protein